MTAFKKMRKGRGAYNINGLSFDFKILQTLVCFDLCLMAFRLVRFGVLCEGVKGEEKYVVKSLRNSIV